MIKKIFKVIKWVILLALLGLCIYGIIKFFPQIKSAYTTIQELIRGLSNV